MLQRVKPNLNHSLYMSPLELWLGVGGSNNVEMEEEQG